MLSLVLLILTQISLNQTPTASEPTPYDYYLTALDYEEANQYDDALKTFQYIIDNYPDDSIAGKAWRKIIEYNLRGGRIVDAINAAEEVKSKITEYPDIYKEAYGYGLAQIYDYYAGEEEPNEYAKVKESIGTTKYLEELLYEKAKLDTSVVDTAALRDKTDKIRELNPHSKYLFDPMFLLSLLLIEAERYGEAKEILLELKNWPDTAVVSKKMPEVLFQLGIVYEAMGRYGEALDVYQVVASEYPEQPEGFNAFKKVIDFNIAGGRAKAIESIVGDRWGDWFGAKYDLEKAKELYCYALMQLRDYYFEVGDQERAEYFEKKLAELE